MSEAAATYNANHAAGVMVNDDVNNILKSIDRFQGVDFVFGGPPCQGFIFYANEEFSLSLL